MLATLRTLYGGQARLNAVFAQHDLIGGGAYALVQAIKTICVALTCASSEARSRSSSSGSSNNSSHPRQAAPSTKEAAGKAMQKAPKEEEKPTTRVARVTRVPRKATKVAAKGIRVRNTLRHQLGTVCTVPSVTNRDTPLSIVGSTQHPLHIGARHMLHHQRRLHLRSLRHQ